MTDPKPERVCANCQFYRTKSTNYGKCDVWQHLPPCVELVRGGGNVVNAAFTCVLFRAREEP